MSGSKKNGRNSKLRKGEIKVGYWVIQAPIVGLINQNSTYLVGDYRNFSRWFRGVIVNSPDNMGPGIGYFPRRNVILVPSLQTFPMNGLLVDAKIQKAPNIKILYYIMYIVWYKYHKI